ncbi:cation:proton antiporter [Goodfellowiella coeruleoviolacea]|uniref:Kef-type K+ transport system, membrane component KefB n=1 Tax=Goodfellowiella coeruleoviolacea TaxID=334858 RepID=A0AAE3KEM6_9PSEU|nr:cation:proton antiporter [Goodfellowiella coeruleoviolacea]MCP2163534.1 Kef-type K+ transport system, membrane component KefB [Goodfellowiella coeruleoviolacea]
MDITALAPTFFLAVVVILLACRVVVLVVARLGQPPVVGEMIAGVLLGPSLVGLISPGLQETLFPQQLKPVLYVVGQIGLVAFMFQAGHEFKSHRTGRIAGTAGAVSLAGMVVPLLLGVGITLLAQGRVNIFVDGVPTGVAAAFVGVALAITAFPMLARIITERGLAGTRFGSLALACGAVDDAVAWILLAFVLTAATGHSGPALITLGGSVLFGIAVATVGRRVLAWVLGQPRLSAQTRLLLTVAVLFAAAWYTDEIGLYAVFGAFCVGIALPSGPVADRVVNTIAPVTNTVFVPLFFAYSGLNTKFGLLTEPSLLVFSAVCVVVAVVGKFGACWAVARLRGEPPEVAARVGALMNARGLMQLVALNIGLQAGIVNQELFTVLVLVALVTTVMATPSLSWLDRRDRRRAARTPSPSATPDVAPAG